MSLLNLLILASLVAAVAFFLAGLLLAPRPAALARPADEKEGRDALERELEKLRRERAAAEESLAEATSKHQAEKTTRAREEEQRVAAERERDQARAELGELGAKEKTLAERLRIAEEENRAAFEREEKAAELWAGQLDSAKHEHKRHDQALEREVEELRAQLAALSAERGRLAAEASAGAESEAEYERLAKAAEEAAARERSALGRLAEMEAGARAKLSELEMAARARLAAAEAALQEKLAVVERAWAAKLATIEEDLQAKLAAAETERQAMQAKLGQGQAEQGAVDDEKEMAALRVRAAEEVAEQRRVEAVSAVQALRGAEAKLKEYDRLAQENAELREQRAMAEGEAKHHAGREEEARDAKVELAAAQSKLAALERVSEENQRLRDEVAELRTHEEASSELERLRATHKQVRLDAELMARRLQELLHERAELVPLRSQAAEAVALAQEVEYLRRREKDLEAQLYASGSYSSREMPAVSGELPVVIPGSDLETNLGVLVCKGGPRTAVLADTQGFLIAGAGESVAQEGLAAYAAVAGEMVSRARMLLPLADIESVRVTDANRMVLACHLFTSAGTGLGVATLGPGEAQAEDTTRAIAGLASIVGGAPAKDDD